MLHVILITLIVPLSLSSGKAECPEVLEKHKAMEKVSDILSAYEAVLDSLWNNYPDIFPYINIEEYIYEMADFVVNLRSRKSALIIGGSKDIGKSSGIFVFTSRRKVTVQYIRVRSQTRSPFITSGKDVWIFVLENYGCYSED